MPRIAIPTPTSFDLEYNRLNWRAYADAIREAGGEPVEVRLDASAAEMMVLAGACEAILLPGSPADIDPAKFGQDRDPATARADLAREQADELLLEHAHRNRKPLLGICFGAQMLNVWRGGTLIQDLNVLPVNHSAARGVQVAHVAMIPLRSLLGELADSGEAMQEDGFFRLPVNSSHHQAVGIAGNGLLVVGRCPQDGVVEALEAPNLDGERHFVLGVQWHPERTVSSSATSRAIFARLIVEAADWAVASARQAAMAG